MNEYQSALNELCDSCEGYNITIRNKLQECIDKLEMYEAVKHTPYIDQLHYVHEHVYACQSDFYSNGGHLDSYHIEKLETAKRILENSLKYIEKVVNDE